ncbi:hypothetical protein JTF08_08460 [Micrococcaceae bacterium RIT802]|nr:hypothetical protein [Micrococcaceae bacterium RIT 802]
MPVIENNREEFQYQLFEAGELAGYVQYRMSGNEIWVLYSCLARNFKSPDLVSALLRRVLEDAHFSRLAVVPFCPAMRAFVEGHPQYLCLVPPSWHARLSDTTHWEEKSGPTTPLDHVRLTGSRRARLRVPVPAAT